MRLREAFSSVFFFLIVVLRREIKPQSLGFPRRSARSFPSSDKTDADGLAVAFVLTLEFTEIACLLVRVDHLAPFHGKRESQRHA
jgi:hypothetical protein